MKKILMIIPYFGTFPNYFSLWLESAKRNSSIDFLIITDNELEVYSQNIIIRKMTFESLIKDIQNKFEFKINLRKPYDLTLYKPAYGYIFSEEIKGYDFWGHCDVDLILGDVRNFIKDEILENNEKILSHGHFCLYKNCEKMNKLFMVKRRDCIYYKNAFSSNVVWNNFDEYPYGVSRIAKMEKIKVYEKLIFADLDMFSYTFRKVAAYFENIDDDDEQIIQYFEWENGKLFNVIIKDNRKLKKEIMYVHFQKRKMELEKTKKIEDKFYILPNKFIFHEITNKDIIELCDTKKNYNYSLVKREEILRNKDEMPLYKKIFSYQRIKRKLFLMKMDKIYKVKPYKFEKGGF